MKDSLLKDQLAESGLEMEFFSALLGIGSAILGGVSASQQAAAQQEAIERQHKYDMQAWKYGKQRIKASYRQELKQWELNTKQEQRRAQYLDKLNAKDYKHKLKIQRFEYNALMRQYNKSTEIYGQQRTFNKLAADAAKEAEYRKLQDATNEIAFQNQDLVIKAMEAEGAAAVKGQSGRSADKSGEAIFASLGRNQAILAESLLSAHADTDAAIRKIAYDKYGADIAAQAARMLMPERGPKPVKPIRTPVAKFLKPRKPSKFDFGPKPIKGAGASPAGAWMGAAANALPSLAGIFQGGLGGGSSYNFSYGSTLNLGSNPLAGGISIGNQTW